MNEALCTIPRRYAELRLDQIKSSNFNPPIRVEEKQLKELLQSIKEVGILVPIAITDENRLADGHRRLACAVHLGHQKVPVCVYDGIDEKKLWIKLNASSKALTPSQWLSAVNEGLELDTDSFPPALRAQIKEAVEIAEGDTVRVDMEAGEVINVSQAKTYKFTPIRKFIGFR